MSSTPRLPSPRLEPRRPRHPREPQAESILDEPTHSRRALVGWGSAMRDEKFVDLVASVEHRGLGSRGRLHVRVRNIEGRHLGCLPCLVLPPHTLVLLSTLHDVGLTQTKMTKRGAVEEALVRAIAQVGKIGPGGGRCDRLRLKLLLVEVPLERPHHGLGGEILAGTAASLVSRPLSQPARKVTMHLICIVRRVVHEEDVGWHSNRLCYARTQQREGLAVASSVHSATDEDWPAVALERRIHARPPCGPRYVPPAPRAGQAWCSTH